MTHKRQLYLNVSLFIVADIESDEDGTKTAIILKNIHESHKGSIAEPEDLPAKSPEWAEVVAQVAAKEALKSAYEQMGKDPEQQEAEPEPMNQLPPTGGASA